MRNHIAAAALVAKFIGITATVYLFNVAGFPVRAHWIRSYQAGVL